MLTIRPSVLRFGGTLCILFFCLVNILNSQVTEKTFWKGYPIFAEKLPDGNLLHIADSSSHLISLITDENGQLFARTGSFGRYQGDLPHITRVSNGSFLFQSGDFLYRYSLQGELEETISLQLASQQFRFDQKTGFARSLNGYFVTVATDISSPTEVAKIVWLSPLGEISKSTTILPNPNGLQLKESKVHQTPSYGFNLEMIFRSDDSEQYWNAHLSPDEQITSIKLGTESATDALFLNQLVTHDNGSIASLNSISKDNPNVGFATFINFDLAGDIIFSKERSSDNPDSWDSAIAAQKLVNQDIVLMYESNNNGNTSPDDAGLNIEILNPSGNTVWENSFPSIKINAASNPTMNPYLLQRSDACFSVIAAKGDEMWAFQPPSPDCGTNPTDSVDLALVLDVSATSPGVWRPVMLDLTISNDGAGTARDIAVQYNIPTDLAYVDIAPSSGYFNYTNGIWTIDELAPNSTEVLTLELFTLVIDPILVYAEVTKVNLPDLDSNPLNGDNENANEDDEVSVILNPSVGLSDLSVSNITPLANFFPGQTTTVTFDLNNTGNQMALGAHKVAAYLSSDDMLSANDTYVGDLNLFDTPIGVLNGLEMDINVPRNMQIGAYQLILNADERNQIFEVDESNNQFGIGVFVEEEPIIFSNKPDLEVNISSVKPTYRIYEPSTFSVTVRNSGGATARDIIVAVPFPEEMAYVSGFASKGEFNTFFKHWNIEEIAPQETQTITMTLFPLVFDQQLIVFAQVTQAFPEDLDSTPGNADCCTAREDDEAAVTVVPDQRAGVNTRSLSANDLQLKPLSVLSIFPNPIMDNMTIRAHSNLDEIPFMIINGFGQIVQKGTVSGQGYQDWDFNVTDLKGGTYSILFQTNAKIEKANFIKVID